MKKIVDTKAGLSRRSVVKGGAMVAATTLFAPTILKAATPVIRYASAGAMPPNEIEMLMTTEYFQKNVLKNYGKVYEIETTFTRGTPESTALLAAGRADIACVSFSSFATAILKDAVPGGMSIVADIFQDAKEGYASNTFFVLEDGPKTIKELKGKKIAVNALGASIDLELRLALKKNGLDPKRDVTIVEVGFPNMGPALREKRVDCAPMVLPFMAVEASKGGLRSLIVGTDALPTFSPICMAARNDFLKEKGELMKAWAADYVGMLEWLYTPANRAKAIEVTAELTKSSAAVLETYYLTNKDYFRERSACIDASRLQPAIDAMVSEGFLPASVDMAKYINTSFLPTPCKM